MIITSVLAEVGTSGRMVRRAIGNDYGADVGCAVEVEHADRCDSTACDICAALGAGFPLSAGHLLSGATEVPVLDAVVRAHYFNGTATPVGVDGWPVDFADWQEWHRANGTRCDGCGAFNYTDGAGQYTGTCGNCLAPVRPPARATWVRESVDGDADVPMTSFHAYCSDAAEAREVQSELQSLGGSRIERDGEFLYVYVPDDVADDVAAELKDAGFDVEVRP